MHDSLDNDTGRPPRRRARLALVLALNAALAVLGARTAGATVTIGGKAITDEDALVDILWPYAKSIDVKNKPLHHFAYFLIHTRVPFAFGTNMDLINAVVFAQIDSFATGVVDPVDKAVQNVLTLDGLKKLAGASEVPAVEQMTSYRTLQTGTVEKPALDAGSPRRQAILRWQASASTARPLFLYRTMNREGADKLVQDFAALKQLADKAMNGALQSGDREMIDKLEKGKALYGHYGDLFQASTYFFEGDANEEAQESSTVNPRANFIVRFQLRPGAQYLLLSPLVTAVRNKSATQKCNDKNNAGILDALTTAYGGAYAKAGNDGYLAGYIGIKHEKRGDFSLAVAKSYRSQLLFLWLVDKVEILPTDDGPSKSSAPTEMPVQQPVLMNDPNACSDQDDYVCQVDERSWEDPDDTYYLTCPEELTPPSGTYSLYHGGKLRLSVSIDSGQKRVKMEGKGLESVMGELFAADGTNLSVALRAE